MVDDSHGAPERFPLHVGGAEIGRHILVFAFAANKRPIERVEHDKAGVVISEVILDRLD
jgi:hypothetical protein